ncbi:response regulator [Corynebacterium silvaticum]|uniref:Response regulator transcription factor n=1 Tax=Corynebacterium silvaticum TaxID=2320431 RepID=A0A7Y4LI84_9CORY|nr:response regulator transcription factor [Corynebacterium silvaticum]ARU45487.1 response regulator transcription factor [Corynebacterium silvaticum]MBH5300067.1 response regulator transcription factor [Corynebacterium silvaticum]NOM65408.1 response regulator transcription factor [Corynebacterium silvaticum]NON70565.1 response regulator transcription factor [Corynebacterium silvaticum]TFA92389.1 response regulator transcription factor [Corynebacterium silvaticum]
MINVGLVDDQQLVRAGFSMVLGSQDDIHIAWEANNGVEALDRATAQPVDVVLMDVQMPIMDGISATKELVARSAMGPTGEPLRVIILTTFDSENYVMEAVENGASGFLLKDTAPEDLLDAVRSVGAQSAVISPAATAKLFRRIRSGQTNKKISDPKRINEGLAEPLTPRELEILELIAMGKSNPEIASQLFISLPTVKTHVGRVLTKTGSRDRVHAVLFAFKRGLVTQDALLGN